jgi:heme-degrading monooxygenase HmoA
MYRIVWEYEVRAEALAVFEQVYGEDGAWVEFFKRSPDYLGTELFKGVGDPARFITLDRWRDRPSYEAFRKTFSSEYSALDTECEKLIVRERTLGVMDDGKG